MQDKVKPVKVKKPKKLKPVTFGPLITEAQSKFYAGFVYKIEIGPYNYIGKKYLYKGPDWRTYQGSGKSWKAALKSLTAQGYKAKYTLIGLCNNDKVLADAEQAEILNAWATGYRLGTLAHNCNWDDGKNTLSRSAWLNKRP